MATGLLSERRRAGAPPAGGAARRRGGTPTAPPGARARYACVGRLDEKETPDTQEAEARIGATFGWVMPTAGLPEVRADQEAVDTLRAQRPDFASMDDGELMAWAEERLDSHFRHLFSQHLLGISYSSLKFPPLILPKLYHVL